jgi:beta-glucuronidase
MARRFRDHVCRPVVDLAGVWDFAFLGDVDPTSVDPRSIAFDDVMPVPGCFDATPKYAARRGTAAYRTTILLEPELADQRLRLEIDGAHHFSLAYVNGRLIGSHAGGFTRFYHDIEAEHLLGPSSLELVLVVDNAFSPRSPLHLEHFDWYHYGGLTRGVRLHRLGRTYIESVEAHTIDTALPTLELYLRYQTLDPGTSVPLRVCWGDRALIDEDCRLDEERGTLTLRLELAGAALWSPESPHLHLLDVRLGGDDHRQRIGLRRVQVEGRHIVINGKPLSVRGINRHEAHPHFGHAVPVAQQLSDLHWLKRMGVNFVRGSHYPQDTAFLDLCDELGICVWNESIGWQHGKEQLNDPGFIAAQSAHIEEMMSMSMSHACVVVWGILNESASDDPSCRPTYERLLGQIRQRDPSRPVTYATNRANGDVCLDLVDIVSVNTYPGWYFETVENIPTWLDGLLANLRARAPHAPLLVAEIGAGAIPGFRDMNQQYWTEDYQASVIDRALGHLLSATTDCVGVCLWHFADCRIGQNARASMGRPRGYNNKGLLDEFRRPKAAFDVAARHFLQARAAADLTTAGPRR